MLQIPALLSTDMSLGGTNSAVVAAACHVAGEEGNIECKKVKWGVVDQYIDTDGM
jgi:hypothetical protein